MYNIRNYSLVISRKCDLNNNVEREKFLKILRLGFEELNIYLYLRRVFISLMFVFLRPIKEVNYLEKPKTYIF